MKLSTPKNQYALVLRLLIENKQKGVTMVTAMKDWFHKFQTRLLELEKSMGEGNVPRSQNLKIRRLPVTTKNRFGHPCTYTNYKSLAPVTYLKNLYEKVNKYGLSQPKK